MVVDVNDEGHITLVPSHGKEGEPQTKGQVDVRSASPNMYGGARGGKYAEYGGVSIEVRELLLECLLQCARIPTFMVDLWFNYDCDLSCGDLFEETVQFLSKVKRRSMGAVDSGLTLY